MEFVTKVPTGYRARWRAPEGASRSKTFPRRAAAKKFLTTVESSKLRGAYVDARAGRVTFKEYATTRQESQLHRASTALLVGSHVRRHMLDTFGDRSMASIRPSEIQSWTR